MGELILKGGWVMVPIIGGSVLALTLVMERAFYFFSIRLDTRKFAQDVFGHVREGEIQEAVQVCDRTLHPLGAVLRAGLEHAGEGTADIERVMEHEANRQVQRAEKNLNLLLVVIGVEPLLGFLGTILGLIQAFMAWEHFSESVTVSVLAGGIYQAMITTAAGLIVAIPYYVLYHVFLGAVNGVTQDLTHYGDELAAALGREATRQAGRPPAF